MPTVPDDRQRRSFRALPDWAGPATRMVHGGSRPDLNAGAVVPPIYQTSTFRFPSEFSESSAHGATYLYSRNANPTVEGAAELVRLSEGGEACRLFASGMGAISAVLVSLLSSGDRLVLPSAVYGGTLGFVRSSLPRLGVEVRELSGTALSEPEEAIADRTAVVLLETPTNPTLRVHDIRRWADAAHARGALLVVDNTIASPANQNPLGRGADLVVHSATKYLGGHADLTAGAVVGRSELVERIDPHQTFGASLDPFAAFLLARSMKTLGLRVDRINENARAVVAALEKEPAVARVHYPGRASAAEEEAAAAQMRGRGGLVSFSLAGGEGASDQLLRRLRIFEIASSFGGVESLVSLPRSTSHRYLSSSERESLGIDPGFVRLSIGIEDARDLTRDLHEALPD